MDKVNPEYQKKLDRVFNIFEDVQYIVVTRGRIDPKLHHTLKNIPHILRQYIVVVTSVNEVEPLDKLFDVLGIKVEAIVGIDHEHIGELRHKIITMFGCNLVMIDDQFTFHAREHSDQGVETTYMLKQISKKNFSAEERERIMMEMFEWTTKKILSGKFGMVAISNRPSNNNMQYDEIYNDRIGGYWGINWEVYSNMTVVPDMSKMKTKEDMYFELCCLQQGIPVVKSSTYAFNRSGGANSKGGCSRFRDLACMTADAEKIQFMFPDFVNLKDKPAQSWGNFGEADTFKDVTVQWKRAYTGLPVADVIGYKPNPARTKQNYPRT